MSAPLTVSALIRELKQLLDRNFPLVLVEGEISNLARPSSGHLYFTLKDAQAQVRCAMFRNRALHLRFKPQDGAHVLVRARISLYEPRGDLQLVVEHMEEAGLGALQRAFEELKQRLATEGLFAAERKRPLPALPQRVGIITSPSGAALRDVLHILARRFPLIPVRIYPTSVQGAAAAAEIVEAIHQANTDQACDVLLLVRGGGSLEDLWPFNEERVARAIAASHVPIITGVGHETDFTIADFVADERAPTPSAAASRAVPDSLFYFRQLEVTQSRLERLIQDGLQRRSQQLDAASRHLYAFHPRLRLVRMRERLAHAYERLQHSKRRLLECYQASLRELLLRLIRHHPRHRLEAQSKRLEQLQIRLAQVGPMRLKLHHAKLRELRLKLESLHPHVRLQALDKRLKHAQLRLWQYLPNMLQQRARRLEGLTLRLTRHHPKLRLQALEGLLNLIEVRLNLTGRHMLQRQNARLERLKLALLEQRPTARMHQLGMHVTALERHLEQGIRQALHDHSTRLAQLAGQLHVLSPLTTLERGYAIVQDQQGRSLSQAAEMHVGQEVVLLMRDGTVSCKVRSQTLGSVGRQGTP